MSSQCRVYDISRPVRTEPAPQPRDPSGGGRAASSRETVEQLVLEHLGLARRLAARYGGRGEPVEELTQVAMLGLVQAARRFDSQRGTAFSSFAVPTILGEIRRYFRDQCWVVRVPRPVHDLHLEIQHTKEYLTTQLQRSPTVKELAAQLDATEEQIIEAELGGHAYAAQSLDAPDGNTKSDGLTLGDSLGHEDNELALLEDRDAVSDLLEKVPDRERTILIRTFYGNRTQKQIAKELGISQMHVSRLLTKTLANLRQSALDTDQSGFGWPQTRPRHNIS